ncbi:MAG: hypothetical protein ACJ72M_07285 [Propionibacteriaceae bacterium]
MPGRFRCIALWLADLVRVARVQALIASTTGIIPAIPFARAWEAVLCGASDDSGRVVTYRTVLIEHFNRKGLRLVCSDGYLFLLGNIHLQGGPEYRYREVEAGRRQHPGQRVEPDLDASRHSGCPY